MRRGVLLGVLAALCGCGPSRREVVRYVLSSPHRRVAVLPFASAPDRPSSGQEAADLFSQELVEMGFVVISRADLKRVLDEQKLSAGVRRDEAARLGKLLGADAVVTGTVGEADSHQVRAPAVFVTRDRVTVVSGSTRHEKERVQVQPERVYPVSTYSATARMIDVSSNALLWVGSGSDQAEQGTVQDAAVGVMRSLARRLGSAMLEKKL